jgi:hypothetical protein
VLVVPLFGCGRFRWGLVVTVFPRRGVAVAEDALAVAVVEALVTVATGGVVVDGTGGMMWKRCNRSKTSAYTEDEKECVCR